MDDKTAQNIKLILKVQAIEQILLDNGLVKPGQIREIVLEKLEYSLHDEEDKKKVKELF